MNGGAKELLPERHESISSFYMTRQNPLTTGKSPLLQRHSDIKTYIYTRRATAATQRLKYKGKQLLQQPPFKSVPAKRTSTPQTRYPAQLCSLFIRTKTALLSSNANIVVCGWRCRSEALCGCCSSCREGGVFLVGLCLRGDDGRYERVVVRGLCVGRRDVERVKAGEDLERAVSWVLKQKKVVWVRGGGVLHSLSSRLPTGRCCSPLSRRRGRSSL